MSDTKKYCDARNGVFQWRIFCLRHSSNMDKQRWCGMIPLWWVGLLISLSWLHSMRQQQAWIHAWVGTSQMPSPVHTNNQPQTILDMRGDNIFWPQAHSLKQVLGFGWRCKKPPQRLRKLLVFSRNRVANEHSSIEWALGIAISRNWRSVILSWTSANTLRKPS